jgi:hypothetical protein
MSRARARQTVRFGVTALLLVLVGIGGFNFVVDPLQVFRRATLTEPHFSTNQRYQNPSLARHYPFDFAVLGTSHMENFTPSRVRAALGGAPLKLAVAGASAREQALMLELALANPKLRRVLWGVLAESFDYSDRVVDDFGPFPWHLYRRDMGLVGQYLWSTATARDSIRALTTAPSTTLESLNTWESQFSYGPERVVAAWTAMGVRWRDPQLLKLYAERVPSWEDTRHVAEQRVIAPILSAPTVRFDLVFPPYSMLEYANDLRIHPERFARRVLLKSHLIERLGSQPNVVIHDFELDPKLTHDFSHFKDLAHFNGSITELILRDVAAGHRRAQPRAAAALAQQLVSFLDGFCAKAPDACDARLRCGQSNLARWIGNGADESKLLREAWVRCK